MYACRNDKRSYRNRGPVLISLFVLIFFLSPTLEMCAFIECIQPPLDSDTMEVNAEKVIIVSMRNFFNCTSLHAVITCGQWPCSVHRLNPYYFDSIYEWNAICECAMCNFSKRYFEIIWIKFFNLDSWWKHFGMAMTIALSTLFWYSFYVLQPFI